MVLFVNMLPPSLDPRSCVPASNLSASFWGLKNSGIDRNRLEQIGIDWNMSSWMNGLLTTYELGCISK